MVPFHQFTAIKVKRHRGPNDQSPHPALGYRTLAEVFREARNATEDSSKVTEDPPEQMLVSLAESTGLSLNSISILSN